MNIKTKTIGALALLAAVTTQATVLFTVETDISTSGDGYDLRVAGNATPGFTFEDAVISRSETFNPDGGGFGFWDALTSNIPGENWYAVGFGAGGGSGAALGPVPDATGLQYLHVTFSGNHMTIQGLDTLDGLDDIGPTRAPDSGSVAGLLGIGLATLGFIRRRA